MMTLSPEAVIVGLNLFATTGVWLRLGGIIAVKKDLKERIVKLEGAVFKSA